MCPYPWPTLSISSDVGSLENVIIRIQDKREIIGQIPRLLLGGIKSFVGEIPFGNTCGANVPLLKSMKIPEELKRIIEENK